ncbi:MAG: dUTP diphosphatase [Bacteriovoracaceae bacterium]
MINVKIVFLEHYDQTFVLPAYETAGAAGMDVRAMLAPGGEVVIEPMERILIPTGLKMAIPEGFELQIRPRSGLSLKTGLLVVNSPGTIDSDYRGELKIILGNLGKISETIKHGDRIAQMVFAPVYKASFTPVQELDSTSRGVGGFGSTGQK